MTLENSALGKKSDYKTQYDNGLLFKIPRSGKRKEIGIDDEKLPFYGVDIWNAYEVSWLNSKGKPIVAIATFYMPADSKYLVESKSLKLYLNSFNDTKFASIDEVKLLIENDLNSLLSTTITLELTELGIAKEEIGVLPGENIDHYDVECTEYDTANPSLLETEAESVTEEINSDLLKSNCLITNQPDWGSVVIKYSGQKINRASLLKYIVSFRNHNEFHEQCVERIFCDLNKLIEPQFLSVYARYTRRGGIDICPYRTTIENFEMPENTRLIRQ